MSLPATHRKTIFQTLLFVTVLAVFYSCDVLEPDATPGEEQIEITGNEIYVVRDGTGYIDLYSMVKTSGTVRLDISSSPKKGELREITKGLLQYQASPGFTKGRDSFEFSVYSQSNTLLTRDAVTIIVESDTANLPCGIYPQNDSVQQVSGPVVIDVLRNDFLCGDSSQLALMIYRPDASFPPHAGTAVVENNRIRYTPGSSFEGTDQIIYKVYDLQDTTRWGIGVVYITEHPSCTFTLYDDTYAFRIDSLYRDIFPGPDTLKLEIFQNDQLCSRAPNQYQFSILDDGHIGKASPGTHTPLEYAIPDTATHTFRDSVIYQMCFQQQCKTAKVYITINY